MTGIFNERPPKAKYVFIWDIEQVLIHVKKLQSNEQLSDRELNLKLAILLFLTSASRCHEICYLDIRYMVRSSDAYRFYFSKVTKTWRKGRAPPRLELKQFSQDESLCVVSTLDSFRQRTESWGKGGQTQLLLSHLLPHREVRSSTLANWVKITLKAAGIDISKYQAHSCRSASTSKAKVQGLSLSDILKRGQWSGESTWQKHYNREIENIENQNHFETVILKS